MFGGLGLAGEIVQRRLALLHAVVAIDLAHDGLVAGLVDAGQVAERHVVVRAHVAVDAPSGEDLGERDDVGLGVAGRDPDRVQLEQFARVVLVEAAAGALAVPAVRPGRVVVVEVAQHGGVLGGRHQQIGEAAEDMRADRLALIGADHPGHEILGLVRHREVVGPEHRPAFVEADRGLAGLNEAGRDLVLERRARKRRIALRAARLATPGHRLALVAHVHRVVALAVHVVASGDALGRLLGPRVLGPSVLGPDVGRQHALLAHDLERGLDHAALFAAVLQAANRAAHIEVAHRGRGRDQIGILESPRALRPNLGLDGAARVGRHPLHVARSRPEPEAAERDLRDEVPRIAVERHGRRPHFVRSG